MQKLIVFSDVHKKIEILDYLRNKYSDNVKICLGDCEMNESDYENYLDDFIFVRGNSDKHFRSEMKKTNTYEGIKVLERSSDNLVPTEMLIKCEKMKLLLCHGHMIVKNTNDYRKDKKADVLLMGHTHHFEIGLDDKDVVRVINPGCSNSRKVRDVDANWEKKPPSYIELVLDNGNIAEIAKMEYPKELI